MVISAQPLPEYDIYINARRNHSDIYHWRLRDIHARPSNQINAFIGIDLTLRIRELPRQGTHH